MKKTMKIVFFGTPEFAVASADAMVKAGYDIVAVVTAPDKIAGRGHKMTKSAVKIWAENNGLRILQPEKLREASFLQALRDINADLFVVIAFRMLPEAVWSMPPLGTFNLHASLLPHYRGAAPINHAIINGEIETGVTTFFLKHDIDTGDIIEQRSIAIGPDDDAGSLHDKLMVLGAEVTITTLGAIESGEAKPVAQDSLGISEKIAPKIFHETCFINWNSSRRDIRNFVRGLSPYPTARAILNIADNTPAEYKVLKVNDGPRPTALACGDTLIADGKLFVGCADGMVEIITMQPQGKRPMTARDYINGLKHTS